MLLQFSVNAKKKTPLHIYHHQVTFYKCFLMIVLVRFNLVLCIGNLQVSLCHIICHLAFSIRNYYWHHNQVTYTVKGTSVDNLKKGLASRTINLAIVSKLNLQKCSFPFSLLVTTNTTHIIQSLIDHFHLPICL